MEYVVMLERHLQGKSSSALVEKSRQRLNLTHKMPRHIKL